MACGLQLPPRFLRAQASVPKLIDISGGTVAPQHQLDDPELLLRRTFGELKGAHFVGKGDREMVKRLLATFEWTMERAMQQAVASAEDGRTIDPAVLRRRATEGHRAAEGHDATLLTSRGGLVVVRSSRKNSMGPAPARSSVGSMSASMSASLPAGLWGMTGMSSASTKLAEVGDGVTGIALGRVTERDSARENQSER